MEKFDQELLEERKEIVQIGEMKDKLTEAYGDLVQASEK
jgi:hypothetical protein